MKKILIPILIILVLAGFAVWFFSSDKLGENGQETTIRDWFPFGGTSDSTPPPTINDPSLEGPGLPVTGLPEILPRLRKISENPIAGATVFSRGQEIVVRLVDRATGHIFETTTESGDLQRIFNTTIPK